MLDDICVKGNDARGRERRKPPFMRYLFLETQGSYHKSPRRYRHESNTLSR